MKQVMFVALSISEVKAFERQKVTAYKSYSAMSQRRVNGITL